AEASPKAHALRKPARDTKPTGPAAPATPARVPRSTKRSALTERPAPAKHGATKARGARRPVQAAPPTLRPAAAPAKRRRARVGHSPRAASVGQIDRSGELRPFVGEDPEPEPSGHVMELHWGDDVPSSRRSEGVVHRWVKRGDALLRHLAEHGAARHEYRADLQAGRFVWVDPEGRVSAEAQATVLCSWSRSTSALAMAWADPLVRAASIPRVEGMPAEQDDVDEETAWRIAMNAADHASADYLY